LIQEALQRRSSELSRPTLKAPAATATPPTTLATPVAPTTPAPLTPVASSPPPAPPPTTPPPPRKKPSPQWGHIILLVVLLMALLGYCSWLFFRSPEPDLAGAKPTPKPTLTNAVAGQPVKGTQARPHTNLVAQAKAKLETIRTPERTELVEGKTNAPAVPAPAEKPPAPAVTAAPPQTVASATNVAPTVTPPPAPTVVTNTPPTVVTSAPPVVVIAPPKPPPAPVRWPKLTVTGIMGRAGGDAVAFVNGQLLKAGDSVGDAQIIAVLENGVRFVCQGETNFIRVGKGE
ncbi:MAG: hypothetical protein NTY53_14830, partial [Kiritimatiellaeota bacterium]|nr:hypothetical protein [Kiritimatiellota bacterium]